ncbi:aspartic proteinase CDR1-like [Brachypodium distachyon]|uniref:aspartic proteinase CDR1-like n=1 Tax=Brachypodium distachyon TaxID=15368 RepID=UPI000D0E17F4|nr:aspartic proteinase CDR1-like [Brachypodium distachyon]|eukprot:XP_024314021.1 aspartic proteinase CDR1-like [Brachypodium distachyon]
MSGFSVEFIHRDSVKSLFHDPTLTPEARLRQAARRSMARHAHAARINNSAAAAGASGSDDSDADVVSPMVPQNFEYLMALDVSTPPVRMLALADTGSSLASSSYARLPCDAFACKALGDAASCRATGSGNNICVYRYAFADGSCTAGPVTVDAFTFSTGLSVPDDGLVGLANGPISLVSQLSAKTPFAHKFSYCLVPYSSSETVSSSLNFGSHAIVSSSPGAATTPLVAGRNKSFYTIALDSIKVAGKPVPLQTTTTKLIVDSGTMLTYLPKAVLDPLVAALTAAIKLPRVKSPETLYAVCYDVRRRAPEDVGKSIPDVTLVLGGGGEVRLPWGNTFVVENKGTTVCLALVESHLPEFILGNVAQQNLHVGFDLERRTVSFAPAIARAPATPPPPHTLITSRGRTSGLSEIGRI